MIVMIRSINITSWRCDRADDAREARYPVWYLIKFVLMVYWMYPN